MRMSSRRIFLLLHMRGDRSRRYRGILILFVSSALVALVTWFTPGLSATSLNLLFRLRGALPPPGDIVIVTIDDESLRRYGQWPWRRSVLADALDRLTEARAVGLDVIYAEPTSPEEDGRLAASIARNGRVVLPAQLYEAPASVVWVRPLPEMARSARALGHAHVALGVDGVARSIQLSKADNRGERLWAFGLEVLRVAEGIGADDFEEGAGWLRFGAFRVPVQDESEGGAAIPGVSILRQNEAAINYAGPAGSFSQWSMADLLAGAIPSAAFAGKIVLIGVTAQSLGDTRVVPFMQFNANGRQGGLEMPGVEIHANAIHTLRGGLSLRSLPDALVFLSALAVMLCATLTVRRLDGWRQVSLLALLLLAILGGSYLAFSRFQLIPPLVPMLTGFGVVVPLLLNRALMASRELDRKLAALVASQQGFLVGDEEAASDAPLLSLSSALPRGLAWKLRAVDDLTTRLVARMSFIDRILTSMGEGVLVADLSGRIVFANQEAMRIFGCRDREMIGAWFDEFLTARGGLAAAPARAAIEEALAGRLGQLEFEVAEPQYYSLLLSALVAPPDAPLGVVALISDVTRRVEMDRLKTETLQLVSHELRTPLTSIRGLSDVLLKFPVPPEQSREMLDTIHAEAVRLGEMLNRYLDLTRLESGAQPLHLASVSCRRLIDECAQHHAVQAAERRIRLRTEVAPDLPSLQADDLLLRQAVGNLIGNAIKYSPPETDVTLAAESAPGGIAIHVRDQGFGVPPEAREKIFEKFYRLERDANSPIVGAGLGLPLVKEIAERHGGRLSLDCPPAGGSIFTLYLPLSI